MNDIKEVILQKYHYSIKNAIHAPENLKIDSYLDATMDSLVIRLNASIAGESLTKFYKVYPSNWWEAVKDRFLPNWYKRRFFPVQYDVIDIEVAAMYPKYVLPETKYGPMRLVMMDKSYVYKVGLDDYN